MDFADLLNEAMNEDQLNVPEQVIKGDIYGDLGIVENDTFSLPRSTTVTISGRFNIPPFLEQEMIHRLEPDEHVVFVKCNFGRKVAPGYQWYADKDYTKFLCKMAEIRIKNPDAEPRRHAGDGSCFNSQITCVVAYKNSRGEEAFFNFKVFRNSNFQLPGVKPCEIDLVRAAAEKICDMFNRCLGVTNIRVLDIHPIMSNYKFSIKKPNQILSMNAIREKFIAGMPTDPRRMLCMFSGEGSKIYINIRNSSGKQATITLFLRGKVNLLGAHDHDTIVYAYNLLSELVTENEMADEYTPDGQMFGQEFHNILIDDETIHVDTDINKD